MVELLLIGLVGLIVYFTLKVAKNEGIKRSRIESKYKRLQEDVRKQRAENAKKQKLADDAKNARDNARDGGLRDKYDRANYDK